MYYAIYGVYVRVRMHIYVFIYIYIYIYIYMYTYIYYMHAHIHLHMRLVYTYVHACMQLTGQYQHLRFGVCDGSFDVNGGWTAQSDPQARLYSCFDSKAYYKGMCWCEYVCVCVCVYIYIYIYIYACVYDLCACIRVWCVTAGGQP
jgi:hypothetical protein